MKTIIYQTSATDNHVGLPNQFVQAFRQHVHTMFCANKQPIDMMDV